MTTTTRRLRDQEPENIMDMRAKYPEEFALAEETLDLAASIFSNRRDKPPGGDELTGLVAVGLIYKIVNVFWAIISTTEKKLPSSSLVRELAEALISLAYLMKEDSPERARLYADRQIIQSSKDINRLLSEPELQGDVTPEMKAEMEKQVQAIIDRRGKKMVKEMRDWKCWGGKFNLEDMARKAGIPPALYALLYTTESRAPHALDILSHVTRNTDNSFEARLPALANRHLVPSAVLVLAALRIGTEAFKITGFDAEVSRLNKQAGGMKRRSSLP